jgi:hypothetical protein
MSTFRRLIGTAQKALDQRSPDTSRSTSGTDWRSLVRSAADSLTGDGAPHGDRQGTARSQGSAAGIPTTSMPSVADPRSGDGGGTGARSGAPDAARLSAEDRRAIARYDYLVRTAEPDQLEQVHREAFERLTPAQRAQLTASMRGELPEGERPRTDAPQDLARSATRLAALDPRRLTRLLGGSGGGRSDGGRVGGRSDGGHAGGPGRAALGAGVVGLGVAGLGAAGGLLAAVAGGAVLSSVGGSLLEAAIGDGIDVDALAPDLGEQLADVTEGVEGLEGADWAADGIGGGVTDVGEQITGLGDQISDLGLGDLFGR